jgi:hypothetical protein
MSDLCYDLKTSDKLEKDRTGSLFIGFQIGYQTHHTLSISQVKCGAICIQYIKSRFVLVEFEQIEISSFHDSIY